MSLRTEKTLFFLITSFLLFCHLSVSADNPVPFQETFFTLPAEVTAESSVRIHAPSGTRGWYSHGLLKRNDCTWNLQDVYSITFEARTASVSGTAGKVLLHLAEGQGRKDMVEEIPCKFTMGGGEKWQKIELPLRSFEIAGGDIRSLRFIASVEFAAGDTAYEVRNMRFTESAGLLMKSSICSKAADGGHADYVFTVKNTTSGTLFCRLNLPKRGWEGFSQKLSKEYLSLNAGETAEVTLTVTVPEGIPPGGHEAAIVEVLPQSGTVPPASLKFITVQRVASPFLLRDESGWREVLDNVSKYDWAKKQYENYLISADKWSPPEKSGVNSDQGTRGVASTGNCSGLRACVYSWLMTRQDVYFKKLRSFLLMFSNPADGYPALMHATSQDIPQEGEMFSLAAEAYDGIRCKLTEAECTQIENTFRLYVDSLLEACCDGGITNWTVFNLGPATECAFILHDLVRLDALLNNPTGLFQQFISGTMTDGWWYEMSVTYNIDCARLLTKFALTARRFGYDYLNMSFPVSYAKMAGRKPYELAGYQGMNFTKFGPFLRNSVSIKLMWDGILDYPDYRGIMFGMGDGHEYAVGSEAFDLAYCAYRDPVYVPILKNSKNRDLIFAVGELPDVQEKPYRRSAASDNSGIALLRSQSGSDREQIQASFKYGTHGGYHGHFDRLSLLSLMRYGRGFWNPESTWYGYGSFMYKFWVQTSMAHNMVVVDGKMQEPKECEPLLFHAGKHLQTVAAECEPRWSNPPFLGGYDKIDAIKAGTDFFVPIPDNPPDVTAVTDYTEPVFARRLQIVTDTCVVIADYQSAEHEHIFDNLIHLRGARPVSGLTRTGHRDQFDSSPLSSGQFIVNVDEYRMDGVAKITSRHHFNEQGADGKNKHDTLELTDDFYHEPGDLYLDMYPVWPKKAQILIGDYPESQPVGRKLEWRVRTDGKIAASGMFYAWILGRDSVTVPLTGVKKLSLETSVSNPRRNSADSIFWGNPVLRCADGKSVPLDSLTPAVSGLKHKIQSGMDSYGGKVRLAGMPCDTSIAAEPKTVSQPCVLTYDLTGLNAVELTAVIGGDFPAGQETNLRKVISSRTQGRTARFLMVLEPHEGISQIVSVEAPDANTVKILLKDGSTETICISGLDSKNEKPHVKLFRNGALTEEATP